eukprot:TRINITY_DN12646_c4_g12_i1.p1 TRINITY_DN12646_c4_g12~~TRINITY_DN12646_c4_g12_i1.p1  ORF type:complete len:751 (+),score=228.69 TRINITY_DN12646_c4_g12_i1:193-2445(+)
MAMMAMFQAETEEPETEGLTTKDRRVFGAQAAVLFDRIDTDGSNSIDRAELERLVRDLVDADEQDLQNLVSHMMTVLDTDNDAIVSRAEFIQAVESGQLDTLIELANQQPEEEAWIQSGDLSQSHALTTDTRAMIAERMQSRPAPDRVEGTMHIEDDEYIYLWQMFNIADNDGSGSIELKELQSLLADATIAGEAVARVMTPERVQEVMEQIDEDQSGELDFNEFCFAFETMMQLHSQSHQSVVEVQAQALAHEVVELQDQLTALKDMFNHEREEAHVHLEEQHERFTHELDQLESQLQTQQGRLTVLEGNEVKHLERIRELERLLGEYEEENETLRNRKSDGRRSTTTVSYDDQSDKGSVFKEQDVIVADCETQTEGDWKQSMAVQDSSSSIELEDQLVQVREELTRCQHDLEASLGRIEELSQRDAAAQQQAALMEETMREGQVLQDELKQQLNKARSQLDALKQGQGDADAQSKSNQQHIHDMTLEIKALKQANADLQAEKQTVDVQLSEALAATRNAQEALAQQRMRSEQMEAEHQAKLVDLQARIEAALRETEQQHEDTKRQLKDANGRLSAMMSTQGDAGEQIRDLEDHIDELNGQLDEKSRMLTKLQEDQRKHASEMSSLTSSKTAAEDKARRLQLRNERERSDHQRQVKDLQQRVESLTLELDSLRHGKTAAESDVLYYKNAYEKVQNSMTERGMAEHSNSDELEFLKRVNQLLTVMRARYETHSIVRTSTSTTTTRTEDIS